MLQAPAGARVLDVGCAFGFGTRILARTYACTGIDSSAGFVRRARREVRSARFAQAKAEALPFRDATFDAAVCLEVIEHLGDERSAIQEIGRVLKPGGELVLSVPHRGLLERWDSLNVYQRRTGRQLTFGEEPSASHWHRHYSAQQLSAVLDGFAIDRVERTGLGLAELLNLGLLAAKPRLYAGLAYLYFAAAAVEDELPLGRLAYNLMVHARKAV